MDIGLVSILLDSVIHASTMIGEHSSRKKSRKRDSLITVVQQVDIDAVASAVSSLKLASFMRGSLTASDVSPALKSPAFRGLIKELFLAVITDHGDEKIEMVKQSMVLVLKSGLGASAGERDVQHFSLCVVDALKEACDSIVGELTKISPEALLPLQQTALLKRLTTVLQNIEEHQASLRMAASAEVISARKMWLSQYRAVCSRVHGRIRPPDFKTNVNLPMEDLYVLPTISTGGPREYMGGQGMDFEPFRSTIDRTVLLGDPGGGKSTLSNYLASHWSGNDEGVVPFHITLREYAKQPTRLPVVQYIEQQLGSVYQHPVPSGLVEGLLLSGSAVVIFDGLDELIDTTMRRQVSETVEVFGIRYPLAKILVTSRRIGYDQARLDPDIFQVRVISEFKAEDVASYVHKWFSCQEEYDEAEAARLAESFIDQSAAVPDLRSNPLMLSLMCILFRGESFIPRNRPDVYEKCANLLFEKWDGHRDIQVPLAARLHIDSALKYVAHWMLETGAGDAGVPRGELVRKMTDYLHGRVFEDQDESVRAADEFVEFCQGRAWVLSDAGTTADGEKLFTFTHRTFMEYFAAFHLTRINDTPEHLARVLLPRVAREEWDVVAQLAIQIVNKSADKGSERALSVMLNEQRRRSVHGRSNVLDFIARCSLFCTVQPPFIRDLSRACLSMAFKGSGQAGHREPEYVILRPWLSLLESNTGTQRNIVIEVHKEMIASALESKESEEWWGACRVLLFGFNFFGMPTLLDYDGPWGAAIMEIATSAAEDLIKYSELEPGCEATLVATGIQTPRETVRKLEKRSAEFGAVFFGAERPKIWGFPSLSTLLYMIASSPQPLEGNPKLGFMEELADELISSFYASDRGQIRPHYLGDHFPYYVHGPAVEILPTKPSSVLEAAVLVYLADFEINHENAKRRRKHEQRGVLKMLAEARDGTAPLDLDVLDEYRLSNRSKNFVQEWASRDVSVFTTDLAGIN